ncbi:MAG: MFS transporter [Chloroflexia bacterium]
MKKLRGSSPRLRRPRLSEAKNRITPTFRILPAVPEEPAGGLLPSQVQTGMRWSIFEGGFAQVFLNTTTGSFVTALTLFLGASDFVLGLVTSLPVLTQLVQLPAAWMVEHRGNRRALTVWSSLGRLFWLVPVVLLFVPMDPVLRLWLVVAAIALAWSLLAISSNAWLSWMSDLIPPTLRGRFFGTRNTVLALVGLVVIFGGGSLLDFARQNGHPEVGFAVLYGAACVAGLLSTVFISRQPEPKLVRVPGGMGFGQMLQAPLRDKSFRAFILTMTIWGIGVNLGVPFFSAQALKNLHVSYQQLATLDMTTVAVGILTAPLWGRWADRAGHRLALTVSMIGASPLALTWLFVTPANIWLLYCNNIMSGIFWTGVNLALNNRLMERAPAAGRSGYLALYSAITGVAAFAASLIGGIIANALAGGNYSLGPLPINNYQAIFLIAGLTRIGVVVFRRRTL